MSRTYLSRCPGCGKLARSSGIRRSTRRLTYSHHYETCCPAAGDRERSIIADRMVQLEFPA